MNPARRVAVTGATGFLGMHLVAALAQEGVGLRLLSRRTDTPSAWNGLGAQIVRGDLEDRAALETLCENADAVIHLAGLTAARNESEFLRVNRDGARRVAEAARRRAPDAAFIAISSLAARAPHLSAYAASKYAGEDAVRAVHDNAGRPCLVLRLPALYGPGDKATLPLFKAAAQPITPLFGRGRIALLHGADAARAIAKLALGPRTGGVHSLADANPAGYTMAEILSEAARAQGRTTRFVRLPDVTLHMAGWAATAGSRLTGRTSIFGAGKAREMLHPDWSVRDAEMLPAPLRGQARPLAQGFAETVAWYRARGWL